MGGKLGSRARSATNDVDTFIAGLPPEHRPIFDTIRQLIRTMVPQADEVLKWGTLAYGLNGSLFALSANKKQVNFYILTTGVIARYKAELAGIPQSACCLRFTPGSKPPLTLLRKVMKTAIAEASA